MSEQDIEIADQDNKRGMFPRKSTSKIENRIISEQERNRDPAENERLYREALAQKEVARKSRK